MPGDQTTGSAPGAVGPAVLDHVAVAVERWSDAWPRYAMELGGAWASGGLNVGFGPAQLRFANGARIEVLQPWEWEANPFLRRFLDTNGPGPHHLTFKVPDLQAALDAADRAGFDPVGVDLRDPMWKEAFLHPRQASGIVVQLAEAAGEWSAPAPEGFPALRRHPPASLDRVTHAVADLDVGLALFGDLLGGTVDGEADGGDGAWHFVDLRWAGPLTVRLVAPTRRADTGAGGRGSVAEYLGHRSGRLHHLALTVDDPATITDATAGRGVVGVGMGDEPAWVVDPQDNFGTGLVLHPTSGTDAGRSGD
jgi:catechol 2,3-dioxygenase-like lactoylglutathione lyase family enzyme